MQEPARKLQMRTTTFQFEGKPATIGVLRSCDENGRPPLLKILRLIRATNSEYGTSLRLAGNRALDHLLTSSCKAKDLRLENVLGRNRHRNYNEIQEVFPCVTGEAATYEKPGTKFGKQVVFAEKDGPRLIFPTWGYEGEEGIALVALGLTTRDIKKDGKDIILSVPESRLIVVPDFPSENGWHMPHPETGIPHGQKVHCSIKSRELYRLNSSYVGLPYRSNSSHYTALFVHLDRPFGGFGIAVEVPEEDAAKIEEPPAKEPEVAQTQKKEEVLLKGIGKKELNALIMGAEKDARDLLGDGSPLDAIAKGAGIRNLLEALKNKQ